MQERPGSVMHVSPVPVKTEYHSAPLSPVLSQTVTIPSNFPATAAPCVHLQLLLPQWWSSTQHHKATNATKEARSTRTERAGSPIKMISASEVFATRAKSFISLGNVQPQSVKIPFILRMLVVQPALVSKIDSSLYQSTSFRKCVY